MARSEVPVRILPAGDSAWLIELPERIDPLVNMRAIRIARDVETAGLPVTDVVVGYRSVMVYIDPLSVGAAGIERRLEEIASTESPDDGVAGARGDVPVCYDGPYGPHLGDVAAFAQGPAEDVIGLHLAPHA